VDPLAAPPERERAPRAVAPVAEVLGRGDVGDVDGVGLADELEADGDRQLRGLPGIPRDARVGWIRARVRHLRRAVEDAAPDERRGLHVAYSSIGFGNFTPTPPSTTRVWPLT